MRGRDRHFGFRRLGEMRAESLGLPASRARSLRLEHAWRRVAGDAIALRTGRLRVQRGVVDVQVEDRRWAAAISPLLPKLCGRLASACPELDIRFCRLRTQGATDRPEMTPVAGGVEAAAPIPAAGGVAADASDAGSSSESVEERLRSIANRYLDKTPDRFRARRS